MNSMENTITPKLLKGTRDFGPLDMARYTYVTDNITTVCKKYGFDQIMTPDIEYAETLLGKYGEEGI